MISLIIPTTTKNQNYTDNLVSNIRSIYPDETQVEIILEQNDNVTLGVNYNNAVARAIGEKIILLHNDMVLKPGFIEQMDKDIAKKRITTYTRIEPPIFNDTYPGKVILDCGTDLETFDSIKFNEFELVHEIVDGGSQLFFGCMKEDYIGIDGYTFKMFCEDDDLHLRCRLAGFEHKVSSAHVYHFVSKTSRAESDYSKIEVASNRNFVRKWGLRTMDQPVKYNIGYLVKNCNQAMLDLLEPWCDRIYIEDGMQVLTSHYIHKEQPNTTYNLAKRIHTTEYSNAYEYDDIVVEFDAKQLTNENFGLLQQLPAIIKDSGEVGEFELDIFKITIHTLEEKQNDLIKCSSFY
jgi:GT2 family glycosyltransferase